MTQTAIVNYHVHADHRQAYHIDAGGAVGKLISPEHAVTEVKVLDERAEGAATTFETDSVGFTTFLTTIKSFGPDQSWKSIYDAELTRLLTKEVHAKDVIIFDHTVRVDDPNSDR